MRYITEEIARQTNKKTIINAYNYEDVSIIQNNNGYVYIERAATEKIRQITSKELRKLFGDKFINFVDNVF